jgi:acyl transferase domain-containing protein
MTADRTVHARTGGSWQALPLAGATGAALAAAADRLARTLARPPVPPLAEVAAELGRAGAAGPHRRVVVARDAGQALALLRRPDPGLVVDGQVLDGPLSTVFMFPGVGDHHAGLAQDAYRDLPAYRAALDRSAARLEPDLGLDLTELLYPSEVPPPGAEPAPPPDPLRAWRDRGRVTGPGGATGPLHHPRVAQPAVFAVGDSLARMLVGWRVAPTAMLGYSLGEYVAAGLAGVFEPADVLAVVAHRAAHIERTPAGAMLVVPLPAADLALADGLTLAAVNGPEQSVVSGRPDAVAGLAAQLGDRGVATLAVPAGRAFHSPMMAPVEQPLRERLRTIPLRPPRVPFLSNVTGSWIRPDEATSPDYWAQHLRQPVRLADNLTELWRLPNVLAVELGAGQMLRSLANQHPARATAVNALVLPGLTTRSGGHGAVAALLGVAAAAWVRGTPVDWSAVGRRRLPADEPTGAGGPA